MKRNFFLPLLIFFLASGACFTTSCNSAKKAKDKASQAVSKAKDTFNQKVHLYDSSWNDRLTMLDGRITQWDSSIQRYKGSLGDRMQKKMKEVKQERDSLKTILSQAKNQTQDQWATFQQSVSDQYSTIVQSMKELGKMNQ